MARRRGHSNTVKARKYIYVKSFQGEPKRSNFDIVEEDLPPLTNEEFLVEALYISVDPYQRAFAKMIPIGSVMIGGQIAKVLESKNKDYPVGAIIYGNLGWRTHTVVNPKTFGKDLFPTYVLPDLGGLSPSLGLGILGMPGNTAYFGFLGACKPKRGQTIAVTSAAGTVGSIVGQMAKVTGCKVIGFAGSQKKLDWIKELGFDHAFNYKTADADTVLSESAPDGIDCFFDNVGGELSDKIIGHMKQGGRVIKCGSISSYNLEDGEIPQSSINETFIKSKELEIQQFMVMKFRDRWQEGILHNLQWIKEGKLKYKEFVTEGFDNILDAFTALLKGQYMGKPIVKV